MLDTGEPFKKSSSNYMVKGLTCNYTWVNTLIGVVNKLCLEACYKTTNTVKLKFWIFRKPESAVRSSGLKLPQYVHFQFNQKWTTLQYVKATAKKKCKDRWTLNCFGQRNPLLLSCTRSALFSFFFIDGMSTYSLITITVLYGVFSCQYKHVWLKIISKKTPWPRKITC